MAQTGKGVRVCQHVRTTYYGRIKLAIPKCCTCRLSRGKVISFINVLQVSQCSR